ncbi:MAG: hypothetical protein AAFZ15_07195 [Bacteroidota bacterium]
MSIHTRIYGGGSLSFGGQPAIDDLLGAGYSAVLVWSVHVDSDGNLILNNTHFVTNGVYQEAEPMNLPSRLAQLHKAGVEIIFSVGAGGTTDFQTIGKLLNGGVPGPGNNLYDNFKALKDAMVNAGGDIDAIDFDNEDALQNSDASIMVNFGCMLGDIGYKSVTLCPYYPAPSFPWGDGTNHVWLDTYNQLLAKRGKAFVSAIHLQCYSGGAGNSPAPWAKMIADAGGETLMIPGLATNQAAAGPWWYNNKQDPPPRPGGSVVKTPSVAMYGEADWSGMLRQGNYPTADDALQAANSSETFFFYCNGYLNLGPGKVFQKGDAVFFAGVPHWGSAPQCDGYSLSGGCSNTYNTNGACPSDLQSQYATWKSTPIDGGFIWLYDSVLNCLLSKCCGGTESDSATTAKDYREAISNGLG